jgi:hypothetical protein
MDASAMTKQIPIRRILSQRRPVATFELHHDNQTYQISVGYFCDGNRLEPAEVFVNGAKVGSMVEAIARDAAVLLSIAMQYGVPLKVLAGAVTREGDNSAASIIGRIVDRLCKEQDT